MRERQPAVALLVLGMTLWACAPFYRADELRARRAEDSAQLKEEAERALASGDGARASEAWEAVRTRSPHPDGSTWLGLARARGLAGRRTEARAAARYGLARADLAPAMERALRLELAQLYAEDGLLEPALTALPDDRLATALEAPALAKILAPLVEAVQQAQGGRHAEALESHERFVQAEGLVQHPRLAAWRRLALAGQQELVARLRLSAEPLVAGALLYRLGQPFALPATLAAPTAAALEAGRDAEAALSRDDLGGAVRGWRRAAAQSPWWADAHWNLAVLLAQCEEFGLAAAHGKRAMALSPREPWTALVTHWSSLAATDRTQADRAVASALPSTASEERRAARAWRERGGALMVAGLLSAGAAGAFAVAGRNESDRIKAGGLATANDIASAARNGQAWNMDAFVLLGLAGGLTLAGAPMVFLNLDPAAPSVGFRGVLP